MHNFRICDLWNRILSHRSFKIAHTFLYSYTRFYADWTFSDGLRCFSILCSNFRWIDRVSETLIWRQAWRAQQHSFRGSKLCSSQRFCWLSFSWNSVKTFWICWDLWNFHFSISILCIHLFQSLGKTNEIVVIVQRRFLKNKWRLRVRSARLDEASSIVRSFNF